uniref:Uncharacterized protein n=1 Tax=Cyprinodon variegatus TaxID=28743 RepID=A0A3Q2DW24_CYPVA
MPGTFPTRLTTILSLLLPVRTFTALLMVILSRLIPFTSTSLSPTCRPASSISKKEKQNNVTHSWGKQNWAAAVVFQRARLPAVLLSSTLLTKMLRPCSEPPRTLKPSFPSKLLSTVTVWRSSQSSPPKT